VLAAGNRVVGVTGTQMINKGTLIEQNSAVTTTLHCNFQNYGQVQVNQGTLAVSQGTNWNSIFVNAGAALLVVTRSSSDAFTFDSSSTATVRGNMQVNGGNLIMFGTYDAAGGRTTVSLGMFDLRYVGRLCRAALVARLLEGLQSCLSVSN
jgi:hypothetical protein